MAFSACRLSRLLARKNAGVLIRYIGSKHTSTTGLILFRNAVSTSTGAILPKPVKTSFGLIRLTVIVIPFLYVGTMISKNFAALLEEHDIFVPEDDDDDD